MLQSGRGWGCSLGEEEGGGWKGERGGKPNCEIARGAYFVVILERKASRDLVGSFKAEIDRHHWLAAEVVGVELHRHTHTHHTRTHTHRHTHAHTHTHTNICIYTLSGAYIFHPQ